MSNTSALFLEITTDIDLESEPDPDFVTNAREALCSESVRSAMKRLGEQFDARRTYPNVIKSVYH